MDGVGKERSLRNRFPGGQYPVDFLKDLVNPIRCRFHTNLFKGLQVRLDARLDHSLKAFNITEDQGPFSPTRSRLRFKATPLLPVLLVKAFGFLEEDQVGVSLFITANRHTWFPGAEIEVRWSQIGPKFFWAALGYSA